LTALEDPATPDEQKAKLKEELAEPQAKAKAKAQRSPSS
jgi:hypothetical protein